MTKTEIALAEAYCELNCWRTPRAMKEVLGRDLTEDEVRTVCHAMDIFIPHEKWIQVWRGEVGNWREVRNYLSRQTQQDQKKTE